MVWCEGMTKSVFAAAAVCLAHFHFSVWIEPTRCICIIRCLLHPPHHATMDSRNLNSKQNFQIFSLHFLHDILQYIHCFMCPHFVFVVFSWTWFDVSFSSSRLWVTPIGQVHTHRHTDILYNAVSTEYWAERLMNDEIGCEKLAQM